MKLLVLNVAYGGSILLARLSPVLEVVVSFLAVQALVATGLTVHFKIWTKIVCGLTRGHPTKSSFY